jgi:hypothetical protein
MTQDMENAQDKGFNDKGWICDTCHQPITKAGDGAVELQGGYSGNGENAKRISGDIHLVHHLTASPRGTKRDEGCYWKKHEIVDGLSSEFTPLPHLLGPKGLMELLEWMQTETLPLKDAIEMTKRLHIPGYEHARLNGK